MLKLIFSFNDITDKDGPMILKKISKITDEKEIMITLKKTNIYFNPVTLFHKASTPSHGKRFQIMMQLNVSNAWKVNKNIFYKQNRREPKFPFFHII